MNFGAAERIADAVLYEGYVLYPYRANAPKNRVRWQFGVVAPRAFSERTGSDPWWMQTECLIDPDQTPAVDIRLRFLQVQARAVERAVDGGRFEPVESLRVGDRDLVPWDEGIARTHDLLDVEVDDLVRHEQVRLLSEPAGAERELMRDADGIVRGRVERRRWPIDAVVRLLAARQGRFIRLGLRVENTTSGTDVDGNRDHAMRRSLVGAHLLLGLHGGAFVSLLDPPADAVEAVGSCTNAGTWPVLVGEPGRRDLLLASPIILYDYPTIAPESPHELYDGTEIDELLALRVMTMTDEEKRQARATDDRAREIVDRTDAIPPAVFERLHGALRQLRPEASASGIGGRVGFPPAPLGGRQADRDPSSGSGVAEWETLLNPPGMPSPQEDSVEIAGTRVVKGSRVTVRPRRRADPIDMFMQDRVARVEGVYRDLEGVVYVAVVLDHDPSADLLAGYGRFLYYAPDELEPVGSDRASCPP